MPTDRSLEVSVLLRSSVSTGWDRGCRRPLFPYSCDGGILVAMKGFFPPVLLLAGSR